MRNVCLGFLIVLDGNFFLRNLYVIGCFFMMKVMCFWINKLYSVFFVCCKEGNFFLIEKIEIFIWCYLNIYI